MHIDTLRRREPKAGVRYRPSKGVSQGLQGKGRINRTGSAPHKKAIVRRLRKNPEFAAEYLKAALEDQDEPRVLLIVLRRLALARGDAKFAWAAGFVREGLL